MKSLYLIASLRNDEVITLANSLENDLGLELFTSWYCPGPKADDYWKYHEQNRGKTYGEALRCYAANHVFEFDKHHLDRTDGAILLLPAGKSCHLEFGYQIGKGKPGWVYFSTGEPDERWDVMYLFANGVAFTYPQLLQQIRSYRD